MYLRDRVAIVTGGGRGIGREVSLLLARQGAKVIVNDPGVGRNGEETSERPADEVVSLIRSEGGIAEANYSSVADYTQTGEMVAQAVDQWGQLDIVVNSAGFLREKMIWNMSEADFDDIISVHLKGHWNMCHHAVRHMRQRNYGRIINFSSGTFLGAVGQCSYAAAKGGIISLTRSIAKETSRFDITCNAISPSADTRMTETEAVRANRKRRLEAGLITQAQYDRTLIPRGPEFIAPLAAYLSTEQAGFISGELFHAERGQVHTYFFGQEHRYLCKGEGGLFSVDELCDLVPSVLMNGLPPVVAKTDNRSVPAA